MVAGEHILPGGGLRQGHLRALPVLRIAGPNAQDQPRQDNCDSGRAVAPDEGGEVPGPPSSDGERFIAAVLEQVIMPRAEGEDLGDQPLLEPLVASPCGYGRFTERP